MTRKNPHKSASQRLLDKMKEETDKARRELIPDGIEKRFGERRKLKGRRKGERD